jgi:hypothetical protein
VPGDALDVVDIIFSRFLGRPRGAGFDRRTNADMGEMAIGPTRFKGWVVS